MSSYNINVGVDSKNQLIHIDFQDIPHVKIKLPRTEVLKFIESMTQSLILLEERINTVWSDKDDTINNS